MKLTNYSCYLLSLFFFKVGVGAILLATGWDSLTLSDDSLINVTIIMALSFTPAAFVRPIFKRLNNFSISHISSLGLCIASILVILEYMLMEVHMVSMFAINFILWIIIFIIEVACEKWYVFLSQDNNLQQTRKLSAISTGTAQIGIITGPLTVILTKPYSNAFPYGIICLSFIVAAVFSIISIWSNTRNISLLQNGAGVKSKLSKKRFSYILGFGLIWPTLTIYNLSIPILGNYQFQSINVAGGLEMLIALSMVIAGFMHPIIMNNAQNKYKNILVFASLFLASISAYVWHSSLIHVVVSVFAVGFCFGYFRIELRAYLSKSFSALEAGEIISTANSLGGILVVAYAFLFYINNIIEMRDGLTLAFPISFIVFGLAVLYVLNYESNSRLAGTQA